MGLLSGNSCNIITLLPLGLDCDSLNASTPDSTNGTLALYITGGTPPYNVSWDNGSQGTLLTNLGPGDYTATVIDYYGDFTATTTCNVGFDSFYLEEFENCKDGSKIYYLADLPSSFTTGKTYELTTQVGCWISSGTTLYSAQTYYNQFAVINTGPYDDCNDCLPAPTPPPVYPTQLCLTYLKNQSLVSQITFSSGNTINGYPSWSATTPNFDIYYNSVNTRWEISGWTSQGDPYYGTPVFLSPLAPPVGTWTLNGAFGYSLNVASGPCTLSTPLNLLVSKTDPTCTTSSNGTISVFASGGIAPYTYSIDGINYQTGNVFTSLLAGTYTIYAKDFNNTISSQSIILTPQETFQNYSINLTPLTSQTSSGLNSETNTYTFKIEVTPTLPATKTITFDMPINVSFTGTSTANPAEITNENNVILFQTYNTSSVTGPSVSPLVTTGPVNPAPQALCFRTFQGTTAFTETFQASITGDGYIVGTISQQSIAPPVEVKLGACPLTSSVRDSVNIINAQLTPITCSYLNSIVQPIVYNNTLVGLVT